MLGSIKLRTVLPRMADSLAVFLLRRGLLDLRASRRHLTLSKPRRLERSVFQIHLRLQLRPPSPLLSSKDAASDDLRFTTTARTIHASYCSQLEPINPNGAPEWLAVRRNHWAVDSASTIRRRAGLPPAVPSPNGLPWVQTFSDDFTGPSGTLNGWTTMLGTGSQYGLTGWGNNEVQTYTADSSNLNISGGALNIVARVQNHGTNVTSARITTQNLFSQAYGLFQFTAKLPAGTSLWPALWLLPKPSSTTSDLASGVYGGWPRSGEIDVMESGLGHSLPPTSQIQGTFNSGASSSAVQSQTGFYNTGNDTSFNTTNLNTYDLLWLPGTNAQTPGTLKWYVNGTLYETRSGGWYNPPAQPIQRRHSISRFILS